MLLERKANQGGFVALGCLVVLICTLAFFIYLNQRAKDLPPASERPSKQTQKKSPAEP